MTAFPSRSSTQSAPQGGFAGHADGIGGDPQFGQAERAHMRAPLGLAAEFEPVCAGERGDDAVGKIGRAHVGFRRRIDRVARRSAEQIAQEREARLARPGAEGGEPVGAELRGETGLAGVPRACVVDADEGRGAKASAEDGFLLGAEQLQLGGQEPHHLALRDQKASRGQHGHDPLAGHLALKMQRQNQTMEVRAAATDDPRRQIGRHRSPVRRRPAFAPVERDLGFERDVLNDDLFIALMARARLRRGRQRHRPVDAQLRCAGTAAARRRRLRRARRLRPRTICRLLHARGLDRRSRRQALQTAKLVLELLVLALGRSQRRGQPLVLLPQPLDLADQSTNHPNKLGRAQGLKRIGRSRRHSELESYFQALDSPSTPLRHKICPGYQQIV
jgi:hypothetical protein